MDDGSLSNFLSNLIDYRGILTNLEWDIIVCVGGAAMCWLGRKRLLWFEIPLLWNAYAATILFIGALYFAPVEANVRLLAFVAIIVALIFVLRFLFKGYEDVGFSAAFAKTQHGIDFKKSLKIADGPLDFLGIGGDKLTKTEEFEKAMVRCASKGRTVRMLLSPPDHPLLQVLAKRNGVDPTEYSKNVRESLRRLAKVKTEQVLDIQVRFYPLQEDKDLQIFRLMFLNERICLWSWTVWGPHLGTENPQIVLLHRKEGSQTDAYNAFHDYFQRLWDDQKCLTVNLADYL